MTGFSKVTCPSAGQSLGLFLTINKKKAQFKPGGIPVVVQQCDSMDEHTDWNCLYLYICAVYKVKGDVLNHWCTTQRFTVQHHKTGPPRQ